MAEEKEVLLEVKDLNVTYGSGRKAFAAVQNANFQIYKGETFGLVGESGSGKTTIGRAILRILPTSGGEILYKGQKINGKIPRALDKQITREIQMIFQDPQSSLNERAKVSYIVGEGLQNVRPDLSAAQREEKVRQALLDGKAVAVPKVYGDEMKFILLSDLDAVAKGYAGIPEPIADGPEAADPEALVLMPGLVFDPQGHRIGYGGGFYDKFLSREPNHPTLALCYDFQMLPHLDTEEHDIPVDTVLWA